MPSHRPTPHPYIRVRAWRRPSNGGGRLSPHTADDVYTRGSGLISPTVRHTEPARVSKDVVRACWPLTCGHGIGGAQLVISKLASGASAPSPSPPRAEGDRAHPRRWMIKIELNRRMNGTLEAMARAIFKSWFVD